MGHINTLLIVGWMIRDTVQIRGISSNTSLSCRSYIHAYIHKHVLEENYLNKKILKSTAKVELCQEDRTDDNEYNAGCNDNPHVLACKLID